MVEFGAVCRLCHGNCKIRIGNTQKIGDGMTIFNFISLFGGLALFPEGCLADLDALSGCPLEQLAEETAAR